MSERKRLEVGTAPLFLGALVALVTLAVLWCPQTGLGEDEDKPRERPASRIDNQEITKETEAATKRGLSWLAAQQKENGSFGDRNVLAVTSLAGIAFLASGSHPNRGPYANEVRGALEYVLKAQDLQGLITDDRMYTHGFATLFLAELWGMTPSLHGKETVRRALAEASPSWRGSSSRREAGTTTPTRTATIPTSR